MLSTVCDWVKVKVFCNVQLLSGNYVGHYNWLYVVRHE